MAGDWRERDARYMQPHRPPVNPRPNTGRQQGNRPRPPAGQGRDDRRGPPNGPPDGRDGGRGPGRDGGRGRPPARPRRKKRKAGKIILTIVLVIIALLVAIWFYIDTSMNRVDAIGDYAGRPAQGSGTNWLIVGSDSRKGLSADQAEDLHTGSESSVAGKRTDSIMVLHLPDNGTKPTMVSLLRDSFVPIPGHGQSKINAAFAWGGAKLLVRTVEQNTGLRVDHYAEIGFGGFAGIVDDVGGIEVCLDEPVKDHYAGIDLPAGCQVLDGPHALGYVRSRHGFDGGDYARTKHQREFIGKLANKVSSPGVLLNPFKAVPLIFDAPGAVTVDDDDHLQHLIAMAWDVRGISSGGVVTTAVPIAGSGGGGLLWDQTKSQELFHDLNHDKAVPKSLITTH